MWKSGNKYIYLVLFCLIILGRIAIGLLQYFDNYSVVLGASINYKEIIDVKLIITLVLLTLLFASEHFKWIKLNIGLLLIAFILVGLKVIYALESDETIISVIISNIIVVAGLIILIKYPLKILKENKI